jgi:predicted nucleotidyltransferase
MTKNKSNNYNIMKTHIEELRRKILPVLQRYDVVKAAIFGSFVRGEMKEGSDVDILVEFKGEKSLLDLAGLKIELEELLGRKADVLTYNSLHPLLKDRILKEQEVIL